MPTKGNTKRRPGQLRPIKIKRGFTDIAAGSVLIEMGRTRVLCTASFEAWVPKWREDSGLGWVTAEYSMLPSSTSPRKRRSRNGHTDGRGTEIQRVVGRVLRSVIDFEKLGPNTINLDCDVLQADGGTRTAAINGSYVALVDAVRFGIKQDFIKENPITTAVAAVSTGIIKGKAVLDLDYEWDSQAEVDMNVAMTDKGEYVEIQGTGEQNTFTAEQLEKLLKLATKGIKEILALQKKSLKIR
ncbi:MAG: ribonuclease PH [Planctomycetes bacterium]|nr:ribonuclease PH [Planctomycetota bacterium]